MPVADLLSLAQRAQQLADRGEAAPDLAREFHRLAGLWSNPYMDADDSRWLGNA